MTMDPPRSTWCSHDVSPTKDGDKCLASCPMGKYVEYQGPQRPGEGVAEGSEGSEGRGHGYDGDLALRGLGHVLLNL